MPENICEYLRREAVSDLFQMNTFSNTWPTWKGEILKSIPHLTPTNVVNLGDNLGDVFRLTGVSGRSQSTVSGAGNAWEALVCWYLNLNLILFLHHRIENNIFHRTSDILHRKLNQVSK